MTGIGVLTILVPYRSAAWAAALRTGIVRPLLSSPSLLPPSQASRQVSTGKGNRVSIAQSCVQFLFLRRRVVEMCFGESQPPKRVVVLFSFSCLKCVPESGAKSGQFLAAMWPRECVPRRGLKRNSKRSLQDATKKHHSMFADVRKQEVASLPRTSFDVISRFPSSTKRLTREFQKTPNMVSLSGNPQQSVTRLIHPSGLFVFIDGH